MSEIRVLAPEPAVIQLEALDARLRALRPARPFDDSAVAFAARLSKALGAEGAARKLPAFQSLAFWLRAAEARRLVQRGRSLARPDELIVPRGVAFHVPPANVDTMFLYSWLLSLFAGNANIIRVSSRVLSMHEWLWTALGSLLGEQEFADVAASTLILSYGHETEVTAACSAACDVRVIWGGNATVDAIRRVPLDARAVDIVFPDRHSLAVLGTDEYSGLDDSGKERVAERFYNDAFWFDQLGCASPRIVAFVGNDRRAADDFWSRVARVSAARGYVPDGTDVVAKFVAACDAVTRLSVRHVRRVSPAVTVVDLGDCVAIPRDGPGAGYFYAVHVPDLELLTPAIRHRDQTVAIFGVQAERLRSWALGLNGRGVDRIVPMGEALAFDSVWDGVDLLQALTRRVTLRTTGLGAMS